MAIFDVSLILARVDQKNQIVHNMIVLVVKNCVRLLKIMNKYFWVILIGFSLSSLASDFPLTNQGAYVLEYLNNNRSTMDPARYLQLKKEINLFDCNAERLSPKCWDDRAGWVIVSISKDTLPWQNELMRKIKKAAKKYTA